MSLKLNEDCNNFAIIKNGKEKIGSISYADDKTGLEDVELEDKYRFQLTPRPVKEKERQCLFVAGESGAGKSYFIREYAELYAKMFPKNNIYLISYLDKDETLDAFKKIIRINAFNPEFLDECMDLDMETEFSDSLVIFDDIDCVVNKKTKEKIYGLLNKMLRIGRHFQISVAYLGHELYNSNDLKSILNESQTITIFPKFLNFKKLKYLFETYFGLSKEQIQKIRSLKDRSVTYIKGADKIILSDTKCFILA
jgi:hypothetical protein